MICILKFSKGRNTLKGVDGCNRYLFCPHCLIMFYTCTKFCGGGRVAQWCWVNFQCRGVLLIWYRVGQGPTALAIGAGGGCLDIFLSSFISLFFLPLSGRPPDID